MSPGEMPSTTYVPVSAGKVSEFTAARTPTVNQAGTVMAFTYRVRKPLSACTILGDGTVKMGATTGPDVVPSVVTISRLPLPSIIDISGFCSTGPGVSCGLNVTPGPGQVP